MSTLAVAPVETITSDWLREQLRKEAERTRFLYETATGCCGAQLHYKQPLTRWTSALCPTCGHFIDVR